jgi:hypothetical protein
MRTKVTTEVDDNILLQFKVCKDPGKPTFKDILTKGMLEYLRSKDPVKSLDIEIGLDRKNLEDKIEMRARMRILDPDQKRIQEFEAEKTADLQRTLEWFETKPEEKLRAIEKGVANWKNIAPRIGAATARQAQDWVMEVVKTWKAQHENGGK